MMAKVGRNEPCPCGSGKKYKKCCEAIREKAERGAQFAASTTASVPGTGPAAKMAAFAEPLLDATDGSHAQMERAFRMATLFWNLAVIPDDHVREQQLGEMLDALGLGGEARTSVSDTAHTMIERHRAMFPELHRR